MADLIDRQETIEAIVKESHKDGAYGYVDASDATKVLNTLPSAERVAHWEKGRCSRCHAHAPFWMMASTYYLSNYCPDCGARMDGEQDG